MCHEAGIFSAWSVLYSVPRVTSLATMTSTGRTTRTPLLGGRRQDPPGVLDAVGLGQALADRLALREQEGVGHPAAEDEHVDLGQQVVDDPILSETLAPPRIAANGRSGRLEQLGEHLDLALHQQPGVGRQQLGDADRRGVRPMRGPERVVDVDVGVGREGRGEGRVVRLLLGVEAEVLEHQDLAGSEALDRVLRADPERVAGDRDVPAQELGQALPDRPQAQAVLDLAVRPPEVAGQDDRGARAGGAALIVGMAARMRESSVTLPSASGTLKSTRTKTRLPATSASRTVSLSIDGQAATGRRAATNAIRSATRQL